MEETSKTANQRLTQLLLLLRLLLLLWLLILLLLVVLLLFLLSTVPLRVLQSVAAAFL